MVGGRVEPLPRQAFPKKAASPGNSHRGVHRLTCPRTIPQIKLIPRICGRPSLTPSAGAPRPRARRQGGRGGRGGGDGGPPASPPAGRRQRPAWWGGAAGGGHPLAAGAGQGGPGGGGGAMTPGVGGGGGGVLFSFFCRQMDLSFCVWLSSTHAWRRHSARLRKNAEACVDASKCTRNKHTPLIHLAHSVDMTS